MKLADLEAFVSTVLDENGRSWRALQFNCPRCINTRRPHQCLVPFSAAGPAKVPGVGSVWKLTGGSGIGDLTLGPSYHLKDSCGLHGFIRAGEWVDAKPAGV